MVELGLGLGLGLTLILTLTQSVVGTPPDTHCNAVCLSSIRVVCGASGIPTNASTSITWHWNWKCPGSPLYKQTSPGLAPTPTALESPTCEGEEADTEETDTRELGRDPGFGGIAPHLHGVGTGEGKEKDKGRDEAERERE